MENETKIQWLTGYNKIKPIEYRLIKRIVHRRWWFNKVEYWIETDYVTMGSFDNKAECYEMAAIAGFNLIDATGE